jgi:hypothetical protein
MARKTHLYELGSSHIRSRSRVVRAQRKTANDGGRLSLSVRVSGNVMVSFSSTSSRHLAGRQIFLQIGGDQALDWR